MTARTTKRRTQFMSRTNDELLRDATPLPGSIGAMIAEAAETVLRERGLTKEEEADRKESRTVLDRHVRSWLRFIQHNSRRRWWIPNLGEDIIHYEVLIVRRPNPEAGALELLKWLASAPDWKRAGLCQVARQDWAEIRREKRVGKYAKSGDGTHRGE